MMQTSAVLYAVICGATILFQILLIAGVPWGRLTQGGVHTGVLPVKNRVLASISIILLIIMACSILSAAAIWPNWPRWMGWVTLVVQGLSTLLNWITPSQLERLIWGPTTAVMLILAGLVLLF